MKLNKLPLNVIGLNRVGLNQIGSPSRRAETSDRPYIDPEVLASLVAVCICDGKSNDDPDRAVIKNLVDPDNPFIISNAAFKLNSGYGKYEVDFTSWSRLIGVKAFSNKFVIENKAFNCAYYVRDTGEDLDEFKAKINNHTDGIIRYTYINQDGIVANLDISPDDSNRVFTFPKSYNSIEGVANHICGFQTPMFVNTGIIIEQIPSHQGAFVTDGKDDLIASTKTVKEMLGGSNEVTVVSMVHQIGLSSLTTINNIRSESVAHLVCRNICSSAGKTGIYGYSRQINADNYPTLINNILGDKKDYTAEGNSALDPTDKFFVQGYKYSGSISEVSQIAYYWTFVSNKVLTTDQINQVISYFNLDKHVKPDILCDVKKQGITNENHAEFGDKLIDFSGNGRDIQLNNIAWKVDSGIGKYATDFTSWINKPTETFHSKSILEAGNVLRTKSATSSMKVKVQFDKEAIGLSFRYFEGGVSKFIYINSNGEYSLPPLEEVGINEFEGFSNNSSSSVTITQIPSHAGALCLDGVNDFGKVTGMPVYKDYTVVTDREIFANIGAISSKNNPGAFVETAGNSVYSFGQATSDLNFIFTRSISYLSKYSYCGQSITAGAAEDGTDMWLGTIRDNDSRFFNGAIYSLMTFPYSMSEFLIERQLKRYKLGTLYPDMVEFRPIINVNIGKTYNVFEIRRTDTNELLYYYINGSAPNNKIGSYLPKGTNIRILVKWDNNRADVTQIKFNGKEYELNRLSDNSYYIDVTLDKSPQKIDIYADEYIRYENIVQPYPAIINLKQDGKTITWGDKLKVGSDIVFVGSANLLPELYTVSDTRYNGVTLYPNTIIKVEKSMVFDNARIYLKANEPSCILSPNRLRIPNSSYKILGYIPDLTGKGNHGRLNNFAYAGMSGANGYVEDFTKWSKNSSLDDVEITYDRIKVNKLTRSTVLYVTSNKFINKIKIVASGIPNGGKLTFTQYPDNAIENNKEFEIGGVTTTGSWGFSIKEGLNLDWSNLVIQQIGEHEGSICFDGTDDHIAISTLSHGGKCMLMKVNWNKDALMLYDQRSNNNSNSFAIYISNFNDEDSIAYSSRNDGKTYIDGVLNTSVKGSQLKDVTHNITITNSNSNNDNTVSPTIGSNAKYNAFYAQMALFDFMLFPEIPSEDEIKELNDVMGIENNIEVS